MTRWLARALGWHEQPPHQIVHAARSDAAKRGHAKRQARTAKQRAAERELMLENARAIRLAKGLPWAL